MEEHFFKFSLFSNFPEIIHGISNRSFGDMRFGQKPTEEVVKNREVFFASLGIKISDAVVSALCHGVNIEAVGINEKGKGSVNAQTAIIQTDGLITKDRGVYLAVTAADCLPILIYDPIQKISGAVHAGWRGIIGQIIPRAIDKLKIIGSEPRNLIVGIGPSICQKHFIVRNDVLSPFLDYYPSATFVRNNDGYVDLKKAAMIDFKKSGIAQNNIEISSHCTACDNGIYGSFRKEKELASAAIAVIGVKN